MKGHRDLDKPSKTVGISEYWAKWLNEVVKSRVRKSKAEIVEEGLKSIKYNIDREVEEYREAIELVKERRELGTED